MCFHRGRLACGLHQVRCTSIFASPFVSLPEPMKFTEVAIPIIGPARAPQTPRHSPAGASSRRAETPSPVAPVVEGTLLASSRGGQPVCQYIQWAALHAMLIVQVLSLRARRVLGAWPTPQDIGSRLRERADLPPT